MQADYILPSVYPPYKRRRIKKACDECRRLKIKCDGLSPCTHCSTYERTCTYDIPNRRSKSLALHARDLESRLQTIPKLLETVNPGLDINNPRLELAHPISGPLQEADLTINSDIAPVVKNCDFLASLPSDSPSLLASKKQQRTRSNPTIPLPTKDVAYDLLAHALQDTCVLHIFVHEPSFYATVDYIYETPTERLMKDHRNSLALFYAALALGVFFADGMGTNLSQFTAVADITDGTPYFNWALRFLNLDECQDLVSLQALCFLVIFLQSSGQLEQCYSYVGIALRSAVALGLHRRQNNILHTVEREIRKRVFWVIWRMDIYSSSILGIPPMLSTDLIDQSLPEPIGDTNSTRNTISHAATDNELQLIGANAHTSLTLIMPKVIRCVKAFKRDIPSSAIDLQNLMNRSGMVEIEQELQTWFQDLPSGLVPGGETTARLERVRQLLRIVYTYVQMVLYEPLLQWMPKQTESFGDPQVFDYLMRYISVTRSIVSTGVLIHKTHVANYSARSTMISTTYSAILSLTVFLLNIQAPSSTKGVVFKEALEGRRILEDLSSRSKFADRYVRKLNIILEKFQDRLQPLHISGPESLNGSMSEESARRTEPGTDIQAKVTHSQPFRVSAGGGEEPLSAQQFMTTPEWSKASQTATSIVQSYKSSRSDTTLQAEFPPSHCNLVFETHYQVPHVFDDVITTASTFQPAASNTDYLISRFDNPDSRPSPAQNFNWTSRQDNSSHSHLVGTNATPLWWPQSFTLDQPLSEYSTLVPSLPRERMGLNLPTSSVEQQAGTSESVPQLALPPEANYVGYIFESVEPTPEQAWDNALVTGMHQWT